MDVEFADAKPAARAAPDKLILPSAFANTRAPAPPLSGPEVSIPVTVPAGRGPRIPIGMPAPPVELSDPTAWPQARGRKSGVTRGEILAMEAEEEMKILAQTPRTKPESAVPVVMAKILYPQSKIAEDWGKGRCGGCGTQLMAPKLRPVELRCPHCDRITLLEATKAKA